MADPKQQAFEDAQKDKELLAGTPGGLAAGAGRDGDADHRQHFASTCGPDHLEVGFLFLLGLVFFVLVVLLGGRASLRIALGGGGGISGLLTSTRTGRADRGVPVRLNIAVVVGVVRDSRMGSEARGGK